MKRYVLKLNGSGVYRLVVVRPNLSSKHYVGQAVKFISRRRAHFQDLRKGFDQK